MALFAVAALAAPLAAQPAPPDRPGMMPGDAAAGGDQVEFEVVSVEARTWSVTARDVESGELLRFKLPPKAFVGQRFTAETGGAATGERITVQGRPDARLDEAIVESPPGAGLGRPGPDAGPMGRERPGGPGFGPGYGDREAAPKRPLHPGARKSGPMEYEIQSVDQRTWTVRARGSDGSTINLEVDPEAFVGYRFRASTDGLRAGQGFSLMATNERPLRDCCRVQSPLGR